MFLDLLKATNKIYINHARRLLQKTNQITVCLGSYRYYSKQDRGPKCNSQCDKKKKPSQENVMQGGPDCPWEDVEKCQDKKYKRIALLSILLAAAALGYIFYSQDPKTKSKKLKKCIESCFVRPKPVCKVPSNGSEFPSHVPYLLIGGGTASFAAFRAIKSANPNAQVLVISNECNYPYMRPPLSKEMWFTENQVSSHNLIFKQWNGTERSLFYEPQDFYTPVNILETNEHGGVSVALGWNVVRIDVVEKLVYLEDGTSISYDKCLIATGATPKNLDVFAEAKPQIQNKVTLFREIFDFQELTEICLTAKSIAIVGGGFLGSELACALGKIGADRKMKVIQIFQEKGNMGKILPEYLSNWTTDKVMKEGVEVIPNTHIEDVTLSEKDNLILHLNNGKKVVADHIIVSVGVDPNTQLAEVSDLEIDPELGGYLVNTEMEARSHLYVAGDCSCFYDTILGRRRVEHHDHAVVSGRLAGENMAGGTKPYLHQSMFWSDLGPDVGYEAIGIVDSALPTVGVFAKASKKNAAKDSISKTSDQIETRNKDEYDSDNEDFRKGVIFYLKDNTVVGIILWNIFNRMSIARQVLKDQRKYDDLNEVAKLFNIHDENSNGD